MLTKLLNAKYGWLALLCLLILLNIAGSWIHGRIDLTAEKRYTISKPTEALLRSLPDRVELTVLLDGDMPAGFRKLANSTEDMLAHFREIAGPSFRYRFARPGDKLDDSTRAYLYDSLRNLGINPTNVKAQVKEGEGSEERILFPGAVIRYGDRVAGVDFLQGQSSVDGIRSLNNAEALLEYKLASAIRKITRDSVPLVGYLSGNGEPLDYRVYDLIEQTIRPNYAFRILPIDSVELIPDAFSALLIVKPQKRFTDRQKLKLDQYIMYGGKVVWMIDNLFASMDSLQRSEGQFVAFDLGLNLEDQLFKYGVRINQDLVQDLQSDKIPSVIGSLGDKPQIEVLPWPYFPLLRHTGNHPIAKNLDYVVAEFPHSIDTVKVNGIRKTILLSTSEEARQLQTPAMVEWGSIRTQADLQNFSKKNIPVSVLLEGAFPSLFANRIPVGLADTLDKLYGRPYRNKGPVDGKMIVAADGDMVLNAFTQNEGPLAMGMNRYTRQQYANREFLLNALEYMLDPSGILETRAKDYTLRLLDQKKVDEQKTFWLIMSLVLPVALVGLGIALFQLYRRKKYAVKA